MRLRPDNMPSPFSVGEVGTAPAVGTVVVEDPMVSPTATLLPPTAEAAFALEPIDCAVRLATIRKRKAGPRVISRAMRALEGRGGLKSFRKLFDSKIRGQQPLVQELLHRVAEAHQPDAVRLLLRAGAVPQISWLTDVIAHGPVALVRILLRACPRGRIFDHCLIFAIDRGNVSVLREVLARGADPNRPQFPKSLTPLMAAIVQPSIGCVELLLRSGANPDSIAIDLNGWGGALGPIKDSGMPGLASCTPLDIADGTGNVRAVRLLRQFGAKLRLQGHCEDVAPIDFDQWEGGRQPFGQVYWKISQGVSAPKIRRALLRVPELTERSDVLLWAACRCRRADVVRLLIEFGERPTSGIWNLFLCGGRGTIRITRMIFGNCDSRENFSYLLPPSIRGGYIQDVRTLLEYGVSVDLAACEVAQKSPTDGGDPDVWLRDTFTPLMAAILDDHLDIARLLLSEGADPNRARRVLPRPENSPWFLNWATYGWEAPANEPVECAGAPLHFAVITGNLRMIRLLLKHGADPHLATGLDDYLEQVHPVSLRTRIKTLLYSRSGAVSGRAVTRSPQRGRNQRSPS